MKAIALQPWASSDTLHAALARDRSMRGERRGSLLDRGLLGHGRCSDRGFVPLDRLRLARHRAGEHLVHARDRNDLEVGIIGAAVASWLFGFLGITFGGW